MLFNLPINSSEKLLILIIDYNLDLTRFKRFKNHKDLVLNTKLMFQNVIESSSIITPPSESSESVESSKSSNTRTSLGSTSGLPWELAPGFSLSVSPSLLEMGFFYPLQVLLLLCYPDLICEES